MAEINTEFVALRHALKDAGVIDDLGVMVNLMIDNAPLPSTSGDFYTRAAALMERESRVQTLRDILAEFRAMHESAKADESLN